MIIFSLPGAFDGFLSIPAEPKIVIHSFGVVFVNGNHFNNAINRQSFFFFVAKA